MNRLPTSIRLLGIGWYVAFCIVAGILGGLWLDKKLETTPLFILIGVVLGTVLAFYGIYRMVLPLVRDLDSGRGSNREGKG